MAKEGDDGSGVREERERPSRSSKTEPELKRASTIPWGSSGQRPSSARDDRDEQEPRPSAVKSSPRTLGYGERKPDRADDGERYRDFSQHVDIVGRPASRTSSPRPKVSSEPYDCEAALTPHLAWLDDEGKLELLGHLGRGDHTRAINMMMIARKRYPRIVSITKAAQVIERAAIARIMSRLGAFDSTPIAKGPVPGGEAKQLFLVVDGVRTLDEVVRASTLPRLKTLEMLEDLVTRGVIEVPEQLAPVAVSSSSSSPTSSPTSSGRSAPGSAPAASHARPKGDARSYESRPDLRSEDVASAPASPPKDRPADPRSRKLSPPPPMRAHTLREGQAPSLASPTPRGGFVTSRDTKTPAEPRPSVRRNIIEDLERAAERNLANPRDSSALTSEEREYEDVGARVTMPGPLDSESVAALLAGEFLKGELEDGGGLRARELPPNPMPIKAPASQPESTPPNKPDSKPASKPDSKPGKEEPEGLPFVLAFGLTPKAPVVTTTMHPEDDDGPAIETTPISQPDRAVSSSRVRAQLDQAALETATISSDKGAVASSPISAPPKAIRRDGDLRPELDAKPISGEEVDIPELVTGPPPSVAPAPQLKIDLPKISAPDRDDDEERRKNSDAIKPLSIALDLGKGANGAGASSRPGSVKVSQRPAALPREEVDEDRASPRSAPRGSLSASAPAAVSEVRTIVRETSPKWLFPLVVLVVLGIAASVVAVVVSLKKGEPGPTARETTTTPEVKPTVATSPVTAIVSAPSSTGAAQSATITLAIDASPKQARVYLDKVLLTSQPIKQTIPRDGKPHEVRVELGGFRPVKTTFTASEDTHLILALDALPPAPPPVVTNTPPPGGDPY